MVRSPPATTPVHAADAPVGRGAPAELPASNLARARDLVFEQGPVALALIDWDGRILHANRAYEQLFGWSSTELRTMSFLDYTHPDDADVGKREVQALRRGEIEVARFEKRYIARDGRRIRGRVDVFAVHDSEGRFVCTAGTVHDVTDLREAEEAQRRKEQLFQIAAGAIYGVVWEWEPATGTIWRSDGLRQLLGYSPDELPPTADAWRELVHPDDLPHVDLRSVALRYESEYRMRHRDGRWITVWDRATVESDASGSPTRVVGVTVDITERRLAASEVRRANAELEERVAERTAELVQANRELEAFTYSVSHDLRAPLRHVAGFAELLRQRSGDSLDGESRRYLDVVLDSSARMGDLLDRLLNLSRLGRMPLQSVVLDPASTAREVARELTPAPPRAVEWRIGRLPAVHADYALVRIVFENLLANALKYSAARTPAIVDVRGHRRDDGFVEIEVEDNGVGFEMRYADRLFGVFERLHPSGEYEGWGVGLASVHRIVVRHGGTVAARSEPGRGATFSFTLPAADAPR
jgi:PAS domain S-box-containing protein